MTLKKKKKQGQIPSRRFNAQFLFTSKDLMYGNILL